MGISEETGYSEWCANDRGETTKRLLLGLRLLGQERVDVRQDAAANDGDRAQELVQLLVVADGELDVSRHDAQLLVVARGVARELEDLGADSPRSTRGRRPCTRPRTWTCATSGRASSP